MCHDFKNERCFLAWISYQNQNSKNEKRKFNLKYQWKNKKQARLSMYSKDLEHVDESKKSLYDRATNLSLIGDWTRKIFTREGHWWAFGQHYIFHWYPWFNYLPISSHICSTIQGYTTWCTMMILHSLLFCQVPTGCFCTHCKSSSSIVTIHHHDHR